MEPTINIPSTGARNIVDKDKLVGVNEDLIELLCNFSSSYKITQQSTQFKNELMQDMDLIKNLHKGKFNEVMKIMRCFLCNHMETSHILNCNHGFCKNCIVDHIYRNTNGYIVFNEDENNGHISTFCPLCNNNLTEEDLISIYGDIQNYKDSAKLRKILADLDRERWFYCFSCERQRGVQQFMKNTCGHMCKSCFSKRGCEEHKSTCSYCNGVIAQTEYGNDQIACKNCKKTFYIIGDFMQEICINNFYCVKCSLDIVESGVCLCHQNPIGFIKKHEVLSAITRTCTHCREERPITGILRLKCCANSICYDCAYNKDQCFKCGTQFNPKILQKIRDYHSQPLS